jgi:hypothetical protein
LASPTDTYNAAIGSDRYVLQAYVASGSVKRLTPISTVTFTQVYQGRTQEYRYAVAGQWDVAEHAWRYLVWDLFDAMLQDPFNQLIPPAPRLTHTDLDAAIMATVMLYNDTK